MDILINILSVIFCLAIGYIFGSIPTAVWIGKIFFHRDPRLEGSKNAGGTNAGRLFGKKVGLLVIIIDMLKLIFPMWLCFILFTYIKFGDYSLCPKPGQFDKYGMNSFYRVGWPVYWLAILGCTIGHCWPCFASFKGGKGVSCYMGTMCGSTWMLGMVPAFTYFLFLKITKKVSLTSIIVSILLTSLVWIWVILLMTGVIPLKYMYLPMYGKSLTPSWVFATVITICTGLLIWRHKENIKRLIAGTERTITWMK